jgi:hypothetical protein
MSSMPQNYCNNLLMAAEYALSLTTKLRHLRNGGSSHMNLVDIWIRLSYMYEDEQSQLPVKK